MERSQPMVTHQKSEVSSSRQSALASQVGSKIPLSEYWWIWGSEGGVGVRNPYSSESMNKDLSLFILKRSATKFIPLISFHRQCIKSKTLRSRRSQKSIFTWKRKGGVRLFFIWISFVALLHSRFASPLSLLFGELFLQIKGSFFYDNTVVSPQILW